MSNKATFGATKPQKKVEPKNDTEIAVAWERETLRSDTKYLSVRFKVDEELRQAILEGAQEINCRMFHNQRKTPGDSKPDFIGYKDSRSVKTPK